MPMREFKIDNENQQIIARQLHARHYSLTLNKELCKNCEICQIICPREAIETKKQPKQQGQKAKPPIIDINTQKCSYCGMCEPICPFNAIQVRVDNEHIVPVIEKESFPQLVHEIEVDTSKCDMGCIECEKACPLNLIHVTFLTPDGKEISAKDIETYPNKQDLKVNVKIDKALCPCCRLCEMKCPKGAISVRKIYHGYLNINQEKCPLNCQDCLDVCPIPSALFLQGNGKVYTNDVFCVFCGTCKLVCPAEGALKMERKSIHHTPVSSGAWNKALEKLTSTTEYSKEVKVKGMEKAQKTVQKRLVLKEEAA
jgi:4Fe-4S ferredoxin